MTTPFKLEQTYVQLLGDGSAHRVNVGPDFWSKIATSPELHEGYLVTRSHLSADWPHWEMHPEGEELVVLLSGAVDLILDDGHTQWTVRLREEHPTWINPRGAWHRAIVHEPGDMLFVTAGRGTQHRPVSG